MGRRGKWWEGSWSPKSTQSANHPYHYSQLLTIQVHPEPMRCPSSPLRWTTADWDVLNRVLWVGAKSFLKRNSLLSFCILDTVTSAMCRLFAHLCLFLQNSRYTRTPFAHSSHPVIVSWCSCHLRWDSKKLKHIETIHTFLEETGQWDLISLYTGALGDIWTLRRIPRFVGFNGRL